MREILDPSPGRKKTRGDVDFYQEAIICRREEGDGCFGTNFFGKVIDGTCWR